jgi:alpha-tubulin suppressor-like RCC1 family protein
VLVPALVVAALGCREDAQSPTAPESGPALDIKSAAALSVRQVSAGGNHTCGVTRDDRAYCWGNNREGQLGDGTTTQRLTPVLVAGGHQFRQVSAGFGHTCGVTTDYRAYCWGDNFDGELGDGTTTDRHTPVLVAGGRRFRQVSAGSFHTCGANLFDHAFCWGGNFRGQLGDGTTTDRLTPVHVHARGLRFRLVSAGNAHTCGVATDASAYCWGNNFKGQLGDGTTTRRLTPVAVRRGLSFRQVRAGGFAHTCGVTTNDQAYCWGLNNEGQLGIGTSGFAQRRLRPVAVLGGLQFRAVSAGNGNYTCGVTTGSLAYCWGHNGFGELGDGTTTRRLTPVAVVGGLQFPRVSAGSFHTCGVATNALAYCWGDNFDGQLGDGTTTDRPRPVPVAGAT